MKLMGASFKAPSGFFGCGGSLSGAIDGAAFELDPDVSFDR
jgi:hypothetical protein